MLPLCDEIDLSPFQLRGNVSEVKRKVKEIFFPTPHHRPFPWGMTDSSPTGRESGNVVRAPRGGNGAEPPHFFY